MQKTVKRRLTLSEIQKIIDECKKIGVFSISLGTESEMLMYKGIDAVITYISDKDFEDFWICTNGLLLDDRKVDLILDSNVTRLLISIDAISPETYMKVRGKGYFQLMANIFNFLNKREKKKLKLPVFRVSFVKYNLNQNEQKRFVQFWNRISEEVDIQPLIDIKNVDDLKHDTIENPYCNYPESMIYIKWNGDFKPCCSEFCKHLTIGNIRDMSVSEAWNSAYMNNLRNQFRGEKRLNRACINCLSSLHSQEIYEPLT